MRSLLTISLFTTVALGQGVTQYIAPKAKPPAGCVDSKAGAYEVSVAPIGKVKRAETFPPREIGKTLQITLNKGTLKDNLDRTGYIADNYQFQFDGPPQAGSIYTGGWSFCQNGSLALGSSTIFYQCLSGDFYNLYDRWWADQCRPINIQVHSLSGQTSSPAPITPNSPKGQSDMGSPDNYIGPGASVTGLSGVSNTIGFGSKATGSSSVTLTNTGASGTKNSSQTMLSMANLPDTTSIVTSTSTSTSTSVAKGSGSTSSGSSSTAAKATNAANIMDTKAPTVALLIGVLGMALV